MEIGSLAEWANALLAFGAFMTAVLLYIMERKRDSVAESLRMKQDREREEAEARRLEQHAREEPSKLSMWIGGFRDAREKWGIVLNNQSNHPFYQVDVDVCADGELVCCRNIRTVPPGMYFVEKQFSGKVDQRIDFAFAEPYDEARMIPLMSAKRYRVERFRFTDRLNNRWQVSEQSLLERVDPVPNGLRQL